MMSFFLEKSLRLSKQAESAKMETGIGRFGPVMGISQRKTVNAISAIAWQFCRSKRQTLWDPDRQAVKAKQSMRAVEPSRATGLTSCSLLSSKMKSENRVKRAIGLC